MHQKTPTYNSNSHFGPLGSHWGTLEGQNLQGGVVGFFFRFQWWFFLLPWLSLGNKNTVGVVRRTVFDYPLLSPYPTLTDKIRKVVFEGAPKKIQKKIGIGDCLSSKLLLCSRVGRLKILPHLILLLFNKSLFPIALLVKQCNHKRSKVCKSLQK